MNSMELALKICKAASDKKAAGIITMDMRGVMFSNLRRADCNSSSCYCRQYSGTAGRKKYFGRSPRRLSRRRMGFA